MAQVIWRKSDRIKVRIGKGEDAIVLVVSPLTQHEKAQTSALISKGSESKNTTDIMNGVMLAIKYAVKGIENVVNSDGSPYELKFTDEGILSDESLEDIMNLPQAAMVTYISSNLVNGVPSKFLDANGKELPEVEILRKTPKKKK